MYAMLHAPLQVGCPEFTLLVVLMCAALSGQQVPALHACQSTICRVFAGRRTCFSTDWPPAYDMSYLDSVGQTKRHNMHDSKCEVQLLLVSATGNSSDCAVHVPISLSQ